LWWLAPQSPQLYTVRIFAMRETLGGGCSFRTAEAGEEHKSTESGHHNKPQHKEPEQDW
jgi:hypothetical protein